MVKLKYFEHLPVEIWTQILWHLRPEFFRRNWRRLLVNKTWYSIAWPILATQVRLTSRGLIRLCRNNGRALDPFLPHLRSLQMDLEIWEQHYIDADRNQYLAEVAHNPDAWNNCVDQAFEDLARVLANSRKLKSLKISVLPLESEFDALAPRFISQSSLSALLTASSTLTSLEIANPMAPPWRKENYGPPKHLCQSINSLFPNLRRLYYHMTTICHALLDVPPGSPFALQELVINLSLERCGAVPADGNFPFRCHDPSSISCKRLQTEIVAQTTSLVQRFPQLRLLRVICHDLPSTNLYIWDAIKRQMTEIGGSRRYLGRPNPFPHSYFNDHDDLLKKLYEADPWHIAHAQKVQGPR